MLNTTAVCVLCTIVWHVQDVLEVPRYSPNTSSWSVWPDLNTKVGIYLGRKEGRPVHMGKVFFPYLGKPAKIL